MTLPELIAENYRLRDQLDELRGRNLIHLADSTCPACGHTRTEDGCVWCLAQHVIRVVRQHFGVRERL